MYAKDKSEKQVESINNTTVNKFEKLIKNKRLAFKHLMKFDYKVLMRNKVSYIYEDVINRFKGLQNNYHFNICDQEDGNNVSYIKKFIRAEMSNGILDDYEIVDTLVQHLYQSTNSKHKKLLWVVYGDILLENIKKNTADLDAYCLKCGKRFKKRSNSHKYCDECADRDIYNVRTVVCLDCGTEFKVPSSVRNKKRCDSCQEKIKREKLRLAAQKCRAK